jgi:hypothetical protein
MNIEVRESGRVIYTGDADEWIDAQLYDLDGKRIDEETDLDYHSLTPILQLSIGGSRKVLVKGGNTSLVDFLVRRIN